MVQDKTTYGKGLADEMKKAINAGGMKEVLYEGINTGEKDYSALVSKIKQSGADLVYFGGLYTEGGLIVRQMRDQGVKAPLMGGDGISDTAEFVKEAGPMAQNVYYSIAAPDASKLPSAQAFIAAYKARFKTDVGPYSASAYAAAKIIIAAIEQGLKESGGKVPNRAVVLKNIAAMHDFPTPIGKVTFDGNGNFILTYRLSKNLLGVTYTIEQSSDLINWTDSGATPVELSDHGNYVLLQATIPVTGNFNFFRLQVTLP